MPRRAGDADSHHVGSRLGIHVRQADRFIRRWRVDTGDHEFLALVRLRHGLDRLDLVLLTEVQLLAAITHHHKAV